MGAVHSIVILSKSKIASANYDKTVRLWDIDTGNCYKMFSGHNDRINCLIKLSRTQLVSGGDDNTIKIWEIIM